MLHRVIIRHLPIEISKTVRWQNPVIEPEEYKSSHNNQKPEPKQITLQHIEQGPSVQLNYFSQSQSKAYSATSNHNKFITQAAKSRLKFRMNKYLIQLERSISFIKATFQLLQILLMNDCYALILKNLDFKYHIYYNLFLIFLMICQRTFAMAF